MAKQIKLFECGVKSSTLSTLQMNVQIDLTEKVLDKTQTTKL